MHFYVAVYLLVEKRLTFRANTDGTEQGFLLELFSQEQHVLNEYR